MSYKSCLLNLVSLTANSSCFVSAESGIKQITSAQYHPALNGLADRDVLTVKQGLKKVMKGRICTHLAKILKAYQLTLHATTSMSSAELLLGHRPMTTVRVEAKQKKQHDASAVDCIFEESVCNKLIGQE